MFDAKFVRISVKFGVGSVGSSAWDSVGGPSDRPVQYLITITRMSHVLRYEKITQRGQRHLVIVQCPPGGCTVPMMDVNRSDLVLVLCHSSPGRAVDGWYIGVSCRSCRLSSLQRDISQHIINHVSARLCAVYVEPNNNNNNNNNNTTIYKAP